MKSKTAIGYWLLLGIKCCHIEGHLIKRHGTISEPYNHVNANIRISLKDCKIMDPNPN